LIALRLLKDYSGIM